MSGISALQGGQADLELAAVDAAVLLRPLASNAPITTLEASGGGLDVTKLNTASGFVTVGNWTKSAGVKLTNSPTINDIKSHGKGSPTRQIASEAEKSITYEPQEFKLINMQTAWGFNPSDVKGPTATGGVRIYIPELPANLLFQAVLLSWDSYNGLDIFRYWIANRANVGKRSDDSMVDSDVDKLGVTLNFTSHAALPGTPVIFGVCGAGWLSLLNSTTSGFSPGIAS
jgi:hypothetical protein